jgi:hypothetical protein
MSVAASSMPSSPMRCFRHNAPGTLDPDKTAHNHDAQSPDHFVLRLVGIELDHGRGIDEGA